jgi:Raf kinase inhibitor-like YbhB/YbcL family protein
MIHMKRYTCLFVACCLALMSAPAVAQEDMLKIVSRDLVYFGAMPHRYTCRGLDTSPPIGWEGVPDGTVTLALCLENAETPAAHWILWNIDPAIESLPEGVSADEIGAALGKNDFDTIGYSGPCSVGTNEKYYFTLYALSGKPSLALGADITSFRRAISPLILEEYTFVVFSMVSQ